MNKGGRTPRPVALNPALVLPLSRGPLKKLKLLVAKASPFPANPKGCCPAHLPLNKEAEQHALRSIRIIHQLKAQLGRGGNKGASKRPGHRLRG